MSLCDLSITIACSANSLSLLNLSEDGREVGGGDGDDDLDDLDERGGDGDVAIEIGSLPVDLRFSLSISALSAKFSAIAAAWSVFNLEFSVVNSVIFVFKQSFSAFNLFVSCLNLSSNFSGATSGCAPGELCGEVATGDCGGESTAILFGGMATFSGELLGVVDGVVGGVVAVVGAGAAGGEAVALTKSLNLEGDFLGVVFTETVKEPDVTA